MKIRYMSDLHLEFSGLEIPQHTLDSETILVLAGDIGLVHNHINLEHSLIPFLVDMGNRFKHVIVVLGNHEHYNGVIADTHTILIHHLTTAGATNVSILNQNTVVIDGVAFIGATLWTDCDDRNPHATYLWKSMTDSRIIFMNQSDKMQGRRLRAVDTADMFRSDREYLFDSVKQQKNLGNKTVVVTHHAPSNLSCHEQYKGHELNMFFYSDMTMDIMDLNPDVWIHGHVHNSFDYMLDSTQQICNTRVLCNPRGYVSKSYEENAEEFDVDKFINI